MDYWLRTGFEPFCIPNGAGADNITAIVRYDNTSTAGPTSSSVDGAILGWDLCIDEQPTNLEPWIPVDLDMANVVAGVQTEIVTGYYENNIPPMVSQRRVVHVGELVESSTGRRCQQRLERYSHDRQHLPS